MTDEKWLENIDKQVPYVPNPDNYKKRKKLPKFDPKDMLFGRDSKRAIKKIIGNNATKNRY